MDDGAILHVDPLADADIAVGIAADNTVVPDAGTGADMDIAKYGAAYEDAKARAIEAIAKGIEACKQLPTDEEKMACRKKVLN